MALTKEQRDLRRKGIGSTDVACILGLNPYKSAIQLWGEKCGLLPEVETDSEAAYWGTALEDVVAQRYADDHSLKVMEKPGTLVESEENPWMVSSPDRIVGQIGNVYVLEVKTAGWRLRGLWGEEGDQVPKAYLVQCAWHRMVTGLDRCDLAVLIGGQDYKEFRLDRDEELEAEILKAARHFWFHNVLGQVQPAPDASESAGKALASLYPRHEVDLKVGDDAVNDLARRLGAVKAAIKPLESEQKLLENEIKGWLKEAEGVEGAWGRILWRKAKDSERTDWKEVALQLRDFVPADEWDKIVKGLTATKPGSRRFLAKFKE